VRGGGADDDQPYTLFVNQTEYGVVLVFSDLDLELAEGVNRQELELVPLGELPLAMGLYREAQVLVSGVPGERMWRC
jgi:hypothetical protein